VLSLACCRLDLRARSFLLTGVLGEESAALASWYQQLIAIDKWQAPALQL
jgi:hypothetical protein